MANFYRVKDGNWNLAESWATTSGGTTYHASTPTSSDDVFFDANTPNGTHTVNVTSNTLDLNFTGFTGTFAGSSDLLVSGNITLGSGMTRTFFGVLTMRATSGTKTITSNAKTLNRIHFNGSGGTFQLADKLTLDRSSSFSGTTSNFYLQAGTFNHNNQEIEFTGENSTIDAATTFYKITKTGTSQCSFIILKNITVSNSFNVNGGSALNRVFIRSRNTSAVDGTQVTITSASNSLTNVNLQDMKGAGTGDWDLSAITGGSGDCGGNTDISFTAPSTWYWHADTGTVSDYTKWYTATNGGGSQMASTRVPLPQDTLKFDSSSFDSGSKTVTQNMFCLGSIDFTGATNTPTFTTSTDAYVFGSITLISGMTLTASTAGYIFENRSNITIDSAGKTWAKSFEFNSYGATLMLKSNLATTNNGDCNIRAGCTLTCVDGENNWELTMAGVIISGTLTLGSGTHTLFKASGNLLQGAGTLNAGTSTIKVTGATTGNVNFNQSRTFYNVWNDTANNYSLNFGGSNTFNDLKVKAGGKLGFAASTTTTVNTLTAIGTSGSPITLSSTTSAAATLTKAGGGTIEVDYCDISYLTATPADTWYAKNSTDSGNNTGWTFRNHRYWVGGGGSWDSATTTNWSIVTGGASGASVPTLSDDVFFDENSGLDGETVTVSAVPATPKDLTMATGDDWSLNVTGALRIYGNTVLENSVTITGTLTFFGVDITLKTNGAVLDRLATTSTKTNKLTLLDSLAVDKSITIANTFDTNDFDVTAASFYNSSGVVSFKSSTVTLTGVDPSPSSDAYVFTNMIPNSGEFNKGTSTIVLANTSNSDIGFLGGDTDFYNLTISRGASTGKVKFVVDSGVVPPYFVGSNSFNIFKDEGTAAHELVFQANAETTVNEFYVNGGSGKLIKIRSSSTDNHTFNKSGEGEVLMIYVDIDYITGEPDETWYAANSTIGVNCVQIYEGVAPTSSRRRASFINFY